MLQNVLTYTDYHCQSEWQKLFAYDKNKTGKITTIIPYVLVINNSINQLAAIDSSSDNYMLELHHKHTHTPRTEMHIFKHFGIIIIKQSIKMQKLPIKMI